MIERNYSAKSTLVFILSVFMIKLTIAIPSMMRILSLEISYYTRFSELEMSIKAAYSY